MHCLVLVVV